MRNHRARVLALALVVALGACAPTDGTETATSVEPSAGSVAPGDSFPTAAFADIDEDPVPEEMALEFQAALRDMAGRPGMTATVMSAEGTTERN